MKFGIAAKEAWACHKPLAFTALAFVALFLTDAIGRVDWCRTIGTPECGSFEFWLNRYQTILAGAMAIGAALIGGHYVLKAADIPIEAERERRTIACQEAFQAARIAVAPCIHAASIILFNARAIRSEPNEPEMNRSAAGKILKLHEGLKKELDHFTIKEISRDLQFDQRAAYLMLVKSLSTYTTIHDERGEAEVLRNLGGIILLLGKVQEALKNFDSRLLEIFVRDSSLLEPTKDDSGVASGAADASPSQS